MTENNLKKKKLDFVIVYLLVKKNLHFVKLTKLSILRFGRFSNAIRNSPHIISLFHD